MSLRDVSMVYVLGEDAAHRSFIRAWLAKNNVHHRRIHSIAPPADKSGGLWTRQAAPPRSKLWHERV